MVVGWNDKSGATKVAASQLLSTESRTPSPSFGRILKKKKNNYFNQKYSFEAKTLSIESTNGEGSLL